MIGKATPGGSGFGGGVGGRIGGPGGTTGGKTGGCGGIGGIGGMGGIGGATKLERRNQSFEEVAGLRPPRNRS